MGFLPDNYRPASGSNSGGSDKKSRYFETKQLGDGESTTFRLCGLHDTGHVIAGWQYFTEEGRPRRFPTFPDNYLDDIGLTYEGKTKGTGERDKPRYFLSFVAFSKEAGDFLVYTFTRRDLREQLEETLSMEDYTTLPSGLANFYLTLKRKGAELDTTFTLIPTLKAPTKSDEKAWSEVADSIWLPALFVGADPFAGKPVGGEPAGLPPTHRDSYGADHEVAAAQPEAIPTGW